MNLTFHPDPKVEEVAVAFALDAVDIAKKNFRVELDWSEPSVKEVEGILAMFHNTLKSERPPEEKIWNMAKAFGSYVGEVYRRQRGGAWGLVEMDGKKFPGLQSDSTFWPWSRAYKRITQGPEENIWHYYQALTAKP